jgi:hypothetical protein
MGSNKNLHSRRNNEYRDFNADSQILLDAMTIYQRDQAALNN